MQTASLGLSAEDVKRLLAEVDENENNLISYAEFVPLAVDVVQIMRLQDDYAVHVDDVTDELMDAAVQILNMDEAQFIAEVMAAVGRTGQSSLDKTQLKALLRSPRFNLTKQQANAAAGEFGSMEAVDADSCKALFAVVLKEIAFALASQNLGEVGVVLTKILEVYDKDSTGLLDAPLVKKGLQTGFPHLTRLQVQSLMNGAPMDEETGQMEYKRHLPKLTALIKAYSSPEAFAERNELSQRAEFQPAQLMGGEDKAGFDKRLKALFDEADKDHSGMLDPAEFETVLKNMDLGLLPDEIDYLLEYGDKDGDGQISIDEFTEIAYSTLSMLARERAINATMYAEAY